MTDDAVAPLTNAARQPPADAPHNPDAVHPAAAPQLIDVVHEPDAATAAAAPLTRETRPVERRWTIGGAAVGAALVVASAIGLATIDGSAIKAMVAAWLWLLPVVGVGAAVGWLIGRMMRRPIAPPVVTAESVEAVEG